MKRIGQGLIALLLAVVLCGAGEGFVVLTYAEAVSDTWLALGYSGIVFTVVSLLFYWQRRSHFLKRMLLLLLVLAISTVLDLAMATLGVYLALLNQWKIQDIGELAGAMVLAIRMYLKFFAILAATVITQATQYLFHRIRDWRKTGYWFW